MADCCRAAVRVNFRFCPQCGAAIVQIGQSQLQNRAPAHNISPPEVFHNAAPNGMAVSAYAQPQHMTGLASTAGGGIQKLIDNRLIVSGLLICGGPMALPALWFSRSFSTTTKTLTTIGYTLLTVVMPIAVTWYFTNAALWPLVEAFSR